MLKSMCPVSQIHAFALSMPSGLVCTRAEEAERAGNLMPRLSLGGTQAEADDTATLETRFNLLKGAGGLPSHRLASFLFTEYIPGPCK